MRIVIRVEDPRQAAGVQALTAAADLTTALAIGPAAWTSHPGGEDVALYLEEEDAPGRAAQLAQAARLRADGPMAHAVITPPMHPSGLQGFDTQAASDCNPALLARRLKAAHRTALLAWEAGRLMLAAGVPPAPVSGRPPQPRRVLHIGAPTPEFLSYAAALAAAEEELTAAFTTFAGFDCLHEGGYEGVLIHAGADPGRAVSFCMALRRNTHLHHLPVAIIGAPPDDALAAEAFRRGASAVARTGADPAVALAALRIDAAANRARSAHERLVARARDKLCDPGTGLMRASVFASHLQAMVRDCATAAKPLSLAILAIDLAPGARRPSAEVWRRGLREVGAIAARLARLSDAACMVEPGVYVIASAGEPISVAATLGERIAAVGECTVFGGGDSGVGPLLFEHRALGLKRGESAEDLLARARRSVARETMTA